MPFHVPGIDLVLEEMSRAPRPCERPLAVTNARHRVGAGAIAGPSARDQAFMRENGADRLHRHVRSVERHDADCRVTIRSPAVVWSSSASLDLDEPVGPAPYELPLTSRRPSSAVVGERAG